MKLPRPMMFGCALLGLAACMGCGSLRMPKPRMADVRPQVESNQKAAVEEFEQRRSNAELEAARTQLEQGEVTAARKKAADVLARSPGNRKARKLLAECQIANDNISAAEQTLRDLIREQPGDSEAHYALGLLLETTGRGAEAHACFAKALELDPANPLYQVSQTAHEDTGQAASPVAFQTAPNGAPASILSAANRNAVLQTAGSAHTRNLLQQALSALEAGDPEGALTAVKQAMDSDRTNHQLPLAFAVCMLRCGYADHGVILLTFSNTRFPGRADIHRALGAAQFQAGVLDEAQVVLQTAVSLDSAHPLSYFLLGQVLAEQGQKASAAEMLRHAHQLDSRYPQAL